MADTESARANTAFEDFVLKHHPDTSPSRQKTLWVGWRACWEARVAPLEQHLLDSEGMQPGDDPVARSISTMLGLAAHIGGLSVRLADSRAMNADLRENVAKLEGMLAVHREHAAGAVP